MRTLLLPWAGLALVVALAGPLGGQEVQKVKVVEKKDGTIALTELKAKEKITPHLFDLDTSSVKKLYVFRNVNLHSRPIKVGGTTYKTGLTLLPGVELQYDLDRNYRDLSAVVGIDDETKAEGEGTLVIEGDKRQLASVPIVYKTVKDKNGRPTKPARPMRKLELNIKDVKQLTVRFTGKDELNSLSLNVSLADAKVKK
jgi:hypothetical protein